MGSLVVLLAGVGDGLELQGGEVSLVDGLLGHLQLVPDVGRLHAGHRGRLYHRVGMGLANLEKKERKKNYIHPPAQIFRQLSPNQAVEKEQASRCCTADVCLCQSVVQQPENGQTCTFFHCSVRTHL